MSNLTGQKNQTKKHVARKKQKKKTAKKKTAEKNSGDASKNFFDHDEMTRRAMEIAEPLCAAEGVELVHVEAVSEQRVETLRVYIDKPGGITLEDCARISRQLHDILDVSIEGIMEHFGLEVSSPGANRPLATKADFQRFKGENVRLKFFDPIEFDPMEKGTESGEGTQKKRRKTVKGLVIGISGDNIEMDINGKLMAIPFDRLIRARLV